MLAGATCLQHNATCLQHPCVASNPLVLQACRAVLSVCLSIGPRSIERAINLSIAICIRLQRLRQHAVAAAVPFRHHSSARRSPHCTCALRAHVPRRLPTRLWRAVAPARAHAHAAPLRRRPLPPRQPSRCVRWRAHGRRSRADGRLPVRALVRDEARRSVRPQPPARQERYVWPHMCAG